VQAGGKDLRIAVDIDGVLADQVSAVLKEIEKDYGVRYNRGDVIRRPLEVWREATSEQRSPGCWPIRIM